MPACGMLLDIVAQNIRQLKKSESKYMWFELDGEDVCSYFVSNIQINELNRSIREILSKANIMKISRRLDSKDTYITNLMYSLDGYQDIQRIELLIYPINFSTDTIIETTTAIMGRMVTNE